MSRSSMGRKIRMGMVGGGDGAFIGAIHRIAAAMDGQIELVCGAFSRDPDTSFLSGAQYFLPKDRVYGSYQEMMRLEAGLDADIRMDVVAIVTPNDKHLDPALCAIEHGFHIMSDKPATLNLQEALVLRDALAGSDIIYGLAHTYCAYPMIKEARQRISENAFGKIRKVVVEYSQGWLAEQDMADNKQAAWRLDPKQAGDSCCMADIGVHAFNLLEYVTGLRVSEICADLASVVDGRVLDDDGCMMLRLDNGARGILMASQISVGDENDVRIRVYGEKMALEWSQSDSNSLILKSNHDGQQILRSGQAYTSDMARAHVRTPPGHPEGYLEAFGNLYRQLAEQIRGKLEGRAAASWSADLPGIDEALRGMTFIQHVVAASAEDTKWHILPNDL